MEGHRLDGVLPSHQREIVESKAVVAPTCQRLHTTNCSGALQTTARGGVSDTASTRDAERVRLTYLCGRLRQVTAPGNREKVLT